MSFSPFGARSILLPAAALAVASLAIAVLAGGRAPCRADEGARASRAPVPDAAAQKAAERLVRDLFKAEYARKKAEDRRALARRLLDQGRETRDDDATRYVLFREAWTLAGEGADHETALASVGEAAAIYDIDGLELSSKALDRVATAGGAVDVWEGVARAYAGVADDALLAERMDLAVRAAASGLAQARKAKNVALVARLKAKGEEFQAARADFPRVEEARATLLAAPEDPAASLVVGRFTCLVLGDWERGLPLLSRGDDEALRTIATRDALGASADADAWAKIGDGWWDAAEKEPLAGRKARLRSRAAHWYEKALPALAGITRTKVEMRLAEARSGAEASPAASGGPRPSGSGFDGPPGAVLALTLDASTLFEKGGRTYAADRSGNGNHALVVGAKPCEGRAGGALLFDGRASHLEVAAARSLEITGEITLAAWIRPAVDVTPQRYMTILGKGRVNGEKGLRYGEPDPDAKGLSSYTMRLADSAFCFHYRSAAPPRWDWYGAAQGIYTAGTWRHVALVYKFGEPDTMRMYVDGEARNGRWTVNGGADRQSPSTGEPLWIGAARTTGADYLEAFDGVIDQVAIYPRVLTPTEMEALRAAGGAR